MMGNTETEEFYKILKEIAMRAQKMGLLAFKGDTFALEMDLECAHKKFNLRLEELLHADNFNFTHDICGIQNNIDRRKAKMIGLFVPRFARRG